MLRKAKPRILGKIWITAPRHGSRRRQPGVLTKRPPSQNGSSATDAGKTMHQSSATPLDLSIDERENRLEIRWRTETGSLNEEILESEFHGGQLDGLPEERDDSPDTLCAEQRKPWGSHLVL